MTFDRDQTHAMIEKSIQMLRESGMRIGKKTEDALYRMGCVGAMSVIMQENEVPPILAVCVMSGRKLSEKTWQEVLAEH